MKKIRLTQGKYALVDDEDYDNLKQWKWCYDQGYCSTTILGKKVRMHRLLMDSPKGFDTDHANNNGLDNQKFNLRICTRSENNHNQRKQLRAKSSQYKGVGWHRTWRVWRAYIKINNNNQFIGNFKNERHAAMAYDIWANIMFGKFAHLNFPNALTN